MKTGVKIVIGIAAIIVIAFLLTIVYDSRNTNQDNEVTHFKEQRMDFLREGVTLSLATRYNEGALLYILEVSNLEQKGDNWNGYFSVNFIDKDGFTLASEKIDLSKFVEHLNAGGQVDKIVTQGEIPMSRSTYWQIEGWNSASNLVNASDFKVE